MPISFDLGSARIPIEVGMGADAPIRGKYRARGTSLDRVVDAASATFATRLELANPDYRIPAGLHCTLNEAAGGVRGDAWHEVTPPIARPYLDRGETQD